MFTRCLDQWRRINRGRPKALECEICKGKYSVMIFRPSFWQFVYYNWSTSEKLIYASALVSVLLSVITSFNYYRLERKRRPRIVGNMGIVEAISHFYLFGWPKRSKVTLYLCMLFIVWGNSILFDSWRESHSVSIVLDRTEEANLRSGHNLIS